MVFATGLEGGVWQDSGSRCGEAAFLYMPHSAVVIPCKSARPLPTREKGGDESAPHPKAGGHVTPIAVLSGVPLSRPHGVALVLIYPCGKARNSPQERR